MLVIDTDAASVLAKGRLLEETKTVFHRHKAVITPKIEKEVKVPLEYGYSYPERVTSKLETVSLRENEKKKCRNWNRDQSVDEGEVEGISVAKNRDGIFFTMDQAAARYAKRKGAQTVAFNTVAKLMLEKDVVEEENLKKSIREIEDKDNRSIEVNSIF